MATIKFETGQTVEFDGTPTQADIEEVASSLGIGGPAQQPTGAKSFLRPKQLLGELGKSISQPIQEAAGDIRGAQERFERGEQGILRTGLTIGAQGAQAGLQAAFGAGLNIFSAAIPDFIEDPIRRATDDVLEGALMSSAGLSIIEGAQAIERQIKQLDPKNQQAISDVFDLAISGLDLAGAGAAVRTAKNIARTGIKTGKNLLKNATQKPIRKLHDSLTPDLRTSAVGKLTDTYFNAFVKDKPSISKKLDRIARNKSRPGAKVTSRNILEQLADEGYIPVVEGKLAKFGDVIDDIAFRQKRIAENIDPILAQGTSITPLSTIREQAFNVLKASPQIGADLGKSISELDRFIKGWQIKFGDDLTELQVNQIRKEMNARTKAFGPDQFTQDTADAVADATRARIDQLYPSGAISEANKEIGRLFDLRKTAGILDNQTINIGALGGQMGRYLAVLGAGTIGGLATGGAGGLVTAGIVAHWGGDVFVDFLRSKKFKQSLKDQIVQEVRKDDKIIAKLIEEVKGADKALLKKTLEGDTIEF